VPLQRLWLPPPSETPPVTEPMELLLITLAV
jgi:hypothetical protein